jgi:hypothetical protein
LSKEYVPFIKRTFAGIWLKHPWIGAKINEQDAFTLWGTLSKKPEN